jgi:hypothetical protein
MNIQVGDLVRVLGNQFLHLVLDISEYEFEELDEALVQRVDNTKDRWVFCKDIVLAENN